MFPLKFRTQTSWNFFSVIGTVWEVLVINFKNQTFKDHCNTVAIPSNCNRDVSAMLLLTIYLYTRCHDFLSLGFCIYSETHLWIALLYRQNYHRVNPPLHSSETTEIFFKHLLSIHMYLYIRIQRAPGTNYCNAGFLSLYLLYFIVLLYRKCCSFKFATWGKRVTPRVGPIYTVS